MAFGDGSIAFAANHHRSISQQVQTESDGVSAEISPDDAFSQQTGGTCIPVAMSGSAALVKTRTTYHGHEIGRVDPLSFRPLIPSH